MALAKSKSKFNLAIVLVGVFLFLFGGGLDLTVLGLPAGVTANVIGIVVILVGIGVR